MKILLKKIFILLLANTVINKVLIIPSHETQRNLLIIPNQKKKTSNYFKKNFYISKRNLVTENNEKKEEENLNSYQTHTIDVNNQNINHLLTSSINATDSKKNPVIIINHQETHHKPQMQESTNSNYIKYEKRDTTQSMDNVSVQDLPVLEQILENISKMYTNFYSKLPDNTDKTSIDDVNEMNSFMIKLKTFTRDVIMNSSNLMNDVNYLQRKIHLIKSGESEMIYFYNMEEKYARLKTQSALMLKDSIRDKWQKINEFSNQYNAQITEIYKDSYELYKFNLSFANQIKKINYSHSQNGENDALNKFDEVLMFSIKLIEVKVDLEKSLINLKSGFEEIKIIGFKVDQLLMELGNKINEREVDIKKEELKKEGELLKAKGGSWVGVKAVLATGLLVML